MSRDWTYHVRGWGCLALIALVSVGMWAALVGLWLIVTK